MDILGISAFYHDSAACLVRDGDIFAAAQEERFTRKKHDPEFPENAVDYCLREAGIAAKDLECVAFYDKPFIKFERLLRETQVPIGLWRNIPVKALTTVAPARMRSTASLPFITPPTPMTFSLPFECL